MRHPSILFFAWVLILCVFLLSACGMEAARLSPTPFQPLPVTATLAVPSTPTPIPPVWLGLDESVPDGLSDALALGDAARPVEEGQTAEVTLTAMNDPRAPITWVFALVAPFPTVVDGVSLDEVHRAWRGEVSPTFGKALLMSYATRAALEAAWGAPADGAVALAEENELIDAAWAARPAWAIVPFEDLQPRWKVLRVDGQSPLDRAFDDHTYGLSVHFGFEGNPEAAARLTSIAGGFPFTNRDPSKMTVLMLTGTSALVRSVAERMNSKGLLYPGEAVRDWLREPDFTHISNEVAFTPDCPPPNPMIINLQFCSNPEHAVLYEDVGVDIVELTGNHLADFGMTPFLYSLDLFQQKGWLVYGGGHNLQQARQPLKIEHNGNKIALLGCNSAGPAHVWATDATPGVAQCDFDWMKAEIDRLRSDGYLPVVTLQHEESYSLTLMPWVIEDFVGLARAGAVIVSGSQAHFPLGFTFDGEHFVHFGPGNLFFDQMDYPVVGTRREFYDRHVFYDGRYISTELLTAMLEDWARPRPMTEEERSTFLSEIFAASPW